MQTLFLISLAFLVGKYVNELFSDKSVEQPAAIEKKYVNVKYYSQGLELSKPFHIEYKMINTSMKTGGWNYEVSYEDMLHHYPDEPIMDAEFYHPICRSYSYTITHAELAKVFFMDREDYLGCLN